MKDGLVMFIFTISQEQLSLVLQVMQFIYLPDIILLSRRSANPTKCRHLCLAGQALLVVVRWSRPCCNFVIPATYRPGLGSGCCDCWACCHCQYCIALAQYSEIWCKKLSISITSEDKDVFSLSGLILTSLTLLLLLLITVDLEEKKVSLVLSNKVLLFCENLKKTDDIL